jgi:hypothetical protein
VLAEMERRGQIKSEALWAQISALVGDNITRMAQVLEGESNSTQMKSNNMTEMVKRAPPSKNSFIIGWSQSRRFNFNEILTAR